jgi:hypothetical protein
VALATAPSGTPALVLEADALTPAEKRHLVALEGRIERGLAVFREVGLALLEIRDKRLFIMSHPTFESYCRDRWGMERQRAYQLMGAAEVSQVLRAEAPSTSRRPASWCPLLNTDPKLVPKAWEAVEARNEPVTAQVIREVVNELTNGNGGNGGGSIQQARPVTPTAKLVAQLTKVRADIEVWKGTHPNRNEKKTVLLAVQAVVEALG